MNNVPVHPFRIIIFCWIVIHQMKIKNTAAYSRYEVQSHAVDLVVLGH